MKHTSHEFCISSIMSCSWTWAVLLMMALLYAVVQLNFEVRPMAVMELRRLVVRGIHGISEQMTAVDARMQMMDILFGIMEA